ncbi:MAG: methyltransferase [Pseudomonadales bacterium]|nr:methyltransferase [Pseudomonadales bacterium]
MIHLPREAWLSRRLHALSEELSAHRVLWQHAAFREPVLPWECDYPPLAARLRTLTLDEAEALHGDPQASAALLAEWLPVDRWLSLAAVSCAARRPLAAWPRAFARDVPGRKWAQIEALVATLHDHDELPCTEWCSGKAHLGRALRHQWNGRRMCALEKNPALIEQGRDLALRHGLQIEMQRCDVLDAEVMSHLVRPAHVIALHACGELHLRLLRCGVAAALPAISFAPCCYHLGAPEHYRPLSQAAGIRPLDLRRDDLRTAVQETVTAPGHARRRRVRAQQWQLGFDLLQREQRGVDEYLPAPPVSAAADFAVYCKGAAQHLQIELPSDAALARYEAAGLQRFRVVTALDLVRHRFRRLLELWLVLDRALYLCDHGYRVEVTEFCARELTPRNLLIQARAG